MKIQKHIEYSHQETWNDCGDIYKDFDIMTRRYLEYCRITGENIENYIEGVLQDDINAYE